MALARADPDRPLGELVLDQRVCAGIGNIYKCNTLWRLRLDPWSPAGTLDGDALCRVYSTARELRLAGRDHPRLGPFRMAGVFRGGQPAQVTMHSGVERFYPRLVAI